MHWPGPRRPQIAPPWALRSSASTSVRRLGLILLLLAAPASAQEFGQWWWRGNLGLGYKSFQRTLDGTTLTDYEQQEIELGLDVNGFVIHPAVGSFDLGVDLFVTELDGTQTVDTDRFGAHGNVSLFERGKYPMRFFVERQTFDYADLETDDPFTLLGAPETLTRWGGRGRIRTGPLKGSLLGFEHTAYDLLESAGRTDVDDTQFFDWSRSFGDIRHRIRVERRDRQYGVVNLAFEDYILNLEEGGTLGEAWRWDLNGNGVYRTLGLAGGAESTYETYFLRNRFLRPVRDRDLLDIRHSHGLSSSEALSSDRHSLSVFYRWRPRPAWEIGPFVEYGMRSADGLNVSAPRAGVLVSWNRASESFTTFLTSQVSYGTLSGSGDNAPPDESQVAYLFTGSLTHRATERFSEEVEIEMSRDELRTSYDPQLDFPDLGVGVSGVGTESNDRFRLTLEHRRREGALSVYGEWSNRESTDMSSAPGFELETMTGNATLSGRRWTVRAFTGETDIRREGRPPERIEFNSASASLRLFRFLQLQASYRMDTRRFELLPALDTEQMELEADLQLGQIILHARAFERVQDPMDLDARTSKGLIISMSRRFGGWLPVVSGDGRRGSIR